MKTIQKQIMLHFFLKRATVKHILELKHESNTMYFSCIEIPVFNLFYDWLNCSR